MKKCPRHMKAMKTMKKNLQPTTARRPMKAMKKRQLPLKVMKAMKTKPPQVIHLRHPGTERSELSHPGLFSEPPSCGAGLPGEVHQCAPDHGTQRASLSPGESSKLFLEPEPEPAAPVFSPNRGANRIAIEEAYAAYDQRRREFEEFMRSARF